MNSTFLWCRLSFDAAKRNTILFAAIFCSSNQNSKIGALDCGKFPNATALKREI